MIDKTMFPDISIPEIPEIPEMPESIPPSTDFLDMSVTEDIDYANLPDSVKRFFELYEQRIRAYAIKREAVIAAQEEYIKKLTA